MQKDVVIIGAGPCGLAAAIELQNIGLDVLVIEKGNIVNAIYHYPTHQTFFSSSLNLSIGSIPFITAKEKPKRNDALVYYREVVKRENIRVHSFERVINIVKNEIDFQVCTTKDNYIAKKVVIATGYYNHPNELGIPGDHLPKVSHYFKEAHPFFQKNVVVIGGKNSAVDATLELERAGASVTVVYRGKDYSASVKPWILPGFKSLVNHGKINMYFEAEVTEIKEETIVIEKDGKQFEMLNDYVFAMVGYHPDYTFLKQMGISIDSITGRPYYDEETMETNVKGIYVAGVIAAGNNANEIFIENGKLHGRKIADALNK